MPLLSRTLLLTLAIALSACASAPPPAPTFDAPAELADAERAVESAEALGAADAAPSELRSARAHLIQARAALEDGADLEAVRLAREAAIDGRVAEAAALTARARARTALLEEVQALRATIIDES